MKRLNDLHAIWIDFNLIEYDYSKFDSNSTIGLFNSIQIQLKKNEKQITRRRYWKSQCKKTILKRHGFEGTPFHAFLFGNGFRKSLIWNYSRDNYDLELMEPNVVLPKPTRMNHYH